MGDDSPPLPRARPGQAARSTGEFSNGTSGENYSGINNALFPHSGDGGAAGTVARAAAFARPLLMAAGGPDALLKRSLVEARPVGVVIDTIKPTEDGEGFVVRLYESFGAQAGAHLTFGAPIREAWLSNTLEDLLSPLAIEAGTVALALRPFQIATLRLK